MATGDLTTVDKVRTYLKDDDAASQDILASLVSSSSAWVTNQIGQRFVTSTTITETRDGDGTTRLILEQAPISSVTSVTVDGDTVPARTTVTGSGWVLNDSAVDLVGYEFTEGVQNVVIVYVISGTVPADLEQAVIEHVALRYYNRSRVGLASATSMGETASYPEGGPTYAYVMGVIESYRRLVIA